MATTERAHAYMRNLRIMVVEPFCDRDDCHGTHVDFLDWEMARRRCNELGSLEVMAELDEEDRHFMLWAVYVLYAYKRYSGRPMSPPPTRRTRNAGYHADLPDFNPEEICWACDDSDCPVCIPQGGNRLRTLVIRERRKARMQSFLNREDIMSDFFRDVYGLEDADDPIMQ